MKVYVLEQSLGSYEDYHVRLIGIYASREDAEKAGKLLDAECLLENVSSPLSEEDEDRWNNCRYDDAERDRLYDEFKAKYGDDILERVMEYNDICYAEYDPCRVTEYDLL